MTGPLYLAGRYLAAHRVKTAILVGALTLILFIPSGLQVLVAQSEAGMRARAEATPLLVGAKGSPLGLVLSSLYFGHEAPERIRWAEATRIADTGLADPIPLYVRFRAGEFPVVGTTLDYLAFRRLEVVRGTPLRRLGDCVLGARVARARGLDAGDAILTSPETVFDLAGVYPLKMRIVGILGERGTPDDDAVFVDVKTAWVIEGLGHGHEDLTRPEAAPRVLQRRDGVVVGNAAVVQYQEITPENEASFHFHGDLAEFPLTAVIVVPNDRKSATILRGRYELPDERHQILDPRTVLDELLETVVVVKSYVLTAFLLVGATTLAVAALVFLLSLRLRRREVETMVKLGGSRARVAGVMLAEVVLVLAASVVLAGVLTALTAWFGSEAVRTLLR